MVVKEESLQSLTGAHGALFVGWCWCIFCSLTVGTKLQGSSGGQRRVTPESHRGPRRPGVFDPKMQISLAPEAKIVEKTSVLRVLEAKILEKTSVFRVL